MTTLIPLMAECVMVGGEPQISIIDWGKVYDDFVPTTTMRLNMGVTVCLCWPGWSVKALALASKHPQFRRNVERRLGDAINRYLDGSW